MSFDILRRPKVDGEVGFSDVMLYYKAMALVRILNWRHDVTTKLWIPLEKMMAGRILAGAWWIPSSDRGLSDWSSPLTDHTLM